MKTKIEGGEIKRTPTSTKSSGEVVDLLAALQRSVDAAKTARGETGRDPTTRGRRGREARQEDRGEEDDDQEVVQRQEDDHEEGRREEDGRQEDDHEEDHHQEGGRAQGQLSQTPRVSARTTISRLSAQATTRVRNGSCTPSLIRTT